MCLLEFCLFWNFVHVSIYAKLSEHMEFCSSTIKYIIPSYINAYDHQAWQDRNLLRGAPTHKSNDYLIRWSGGITWKIYTFHHYYPSAYGHQTCWGGDLPWGAPTHKVTSSFNQVILQDPMANKKHYLSNTTTSMTSKLDRFVTYSQEISPMKSHDPSIRWCCHVTGQIKYVICPFSLDQWLASM